MLAGPATITELIRGYETLGRNGSLERRLLDGLAAALGGRRRGGTHPRGGPAGVPRGRMARDHAAGGLGRGPVAARLAELWTVWEPQRDDYVRRALDLVGRPEFRGSG